MTDETKQSEKANKPVDTLRDGPLSVSVFQNQGEKGDYFNVVPRKIYTSTDGQVRESKSLSGTEPLRMANLLTKGYDRVNEFREQMKQGKSRDGERER